MFPVSITSQENRTKRWEELIFLAFSQKLGRPSGMKIIFLEFSLVDHSAEKFRAHNLKGVAITQVYIWRRALFDSLDRKGIPPVEVKRYHHLNLFLVWNLSLRFFYTSFRSPVSKIVVGGPLKPLLVDRRVLAKALVRVRLGYLGTFQTFHLMQARS